MPDTRKATFSSDVFPFAESVYELVVRTVNGDEVVIWSNVTERENEQAEDIVKSLLGKFLRGKNKPIEKPRSRQDFSRSNNLGHSRSVAHSNLHMERAQMQDAFFSSPENLAILADTMNVPLSANQANQLSNPLDAMEQTQPVTLELVAPLDRPVPCQ